MLLTVEDSLLTGKIWSVKLKELLSSQFMIDVDDPDRRSSTPLLYMTSLLTERSRLHSDVCEAFLLGTGAGGVSRELSESKMFQVSPASEPHNSNTRVT